MAQSSIVSIQFTPDATAEEQSALINHIRQQFMPVGVGGMEAPVGDLAQKQYDFVGLEKSAVANLLEFLGHHKNVIVVSK